MEVVYIGFGITFDRKAPHNKKAATIFKFGRQKAQAFEPGWNLEVFFHEVWKGFTQYSWRTKRIVEGCDLAFREFMNP